MSVIHRLKMFCQNNPLGLRLLAAILICSSAITLIATATQLWIDYRYEVSAIDERIQQIETSSLRSLSNSLWEISPAQVQVQLDGLIQLPDVHYLAITSQYGDAYSAGQKPTQGYQLRRYYELTHSNHKGEAVPVGDLTVIISLDEVYRRLGDKVLLILASQGIKTFLVSVFILSIFHHLVTRHLSAMAGYARRLKLDKLDQSLVLRRSQKQPDELGDVVSAMNTMRETMLSDIQKRAQAEQSLAEINQQLEQLNSELESRVEQRTRQLEERSRQLENRNQELEKTLIKLKAAQKQLVESEKMVALGGLVAGVAHEINTPIGIGFTTATFLEDQARVAVENKPDDRMAKLALESSTLICQNLERAAHLIRAFKQVSVDQSSEQRRHFDLMQYLDEVLLSLKPGLKKASPDVVISGPDELWLDSYPGSYYQIFSNLILNSVVHGFENKTAGVIEVSVRKVTGSLQAKEELVIEYRDNGVGIPDELGAKVFDPFVTSKRNQGCSGLGMHICYNLVTQLLKGRIQLLPSEQGVHFSIHLPLTLD